MKFYLVAFSFFSCAQSGKVINSVSCSSRVNLQYDKTTVKGVMAKKKSKKITISFLNYFKDSIRAYIDGNLQFSDIVITDNVSGKSNKNFTYHYSNDSHIPILKVETKDGNCFDIQVKGKYKLIYIFYDSSKRWTVRFSNKYYVEN